MNIILKKFTSFINIIFLLISILMFYFAIRSPIFNINNLTSEFLFFLIIFLLIISILLLNNKSRVFLVKGYDRCSKYFINNLSKISIGLFIVAIIIQIVIIFLTTIPIGWDVAQIFKGVKNVMAGDNTRISSYLSRYDNNSMYFYIMYALSSIGNLFIKTAGNTWIYWQLLNILILDVGIILLFLATKKLFDLKYAYSVAYLLAISMMFSPHLLIPYTDIMALSLTCLMLYLYSIIHSSIKYRRYFITILLGIVVSITFLLKPSAIIVVIAFFVVSIIKAGYINIKKLSLVLIFFLSVLVTYQSYAVFKEKQNIIVYNVDDKFPETHWIMMGLTKSGGYNSSDVKKTGSIKGLKAKKEFNIKIIKERLSNYGLLNYTKFLFKKFANNVADGDFAYGFDGRQQKQKKKANFKLQSVLRSFYYPNGQHIKDSKFIMHLSWLFTIVGLILAYTKKDNYYILVLKVSILGCLLFLLIFEGGRSRYIIQFLPLIYLVAIYGYYNFVNNKWYQKINNINYIKYKY
ncbi:hypothetical protein [Mycoplasma sp. P36-A1]|uniref:hypothetical protein n=1 Tax=Mycoplasma sp. P36-A1 TaxID=3252900 RepID=UPI003C2E425E